MTDEDATGEVAGAADPSPSANLPEVSNFEAAGETSPKRGSAVMGVPIDVVISVGRAKPLISELIELRRDSVLALDSKIEDPVEVFVGEKLIARGELQELDDGSGCLGVRLTEVADLSQGF